MLSLLATKTAICLLYLRVLSFRHARHAVHALLALILVANGIWTLYTVLTACRPLYASWTLPTPTTLSSGEDEETAAWSCRPVDVWYANTALHIGTDVLLYLLPLPVIARLHAVPRQKKAGLYAVLALGLFVCAVSAVRLWDLTMQVSRPDAMYDNVSISYLTVVEINAAIVCACCMTLRPLMGRLFPRLCGPAAGRAGRDVEGGAAGAAVGGGVRGPPTIGSKPLRKMQARRHDRDGSQLLGEDDDEEAETAARNEKGSIRTETERTSFAETVSEPEKGWMPREPQPVHTVEKRDAALGLAEAGAVIRGH